MSDFEPFDDELGTALRHRARDMGTTALGTANAHDAVLARARCRKAVPSSSSNGSKSLILALPRAAA